MKKRKIELFIMILAILTAVAQVIYSVCYAYSIRYSQYGGVGLFIALLAFEFLIVLLYAIFTVRGVIKGSAQFVLSLKDGGAVKVTSSAFDELSHSISTVSAHFEALDKKNELKKELLINCIKLSDRAELIKAAMPLLLDITKANACCYYLVNNGTNKLETLDSCGFSTKLYRELDISIGEGFEGVCCKTGKTRMSTVDDEGLYSSTESNISKKYKNLMAVPVMSAESCVGVLTLAYIGEILDENVSDAEEIATYFAAAHEKDTRFEYYARQADEIKLHYNIIRDITSEVKKKDEEIALLKAELGELKKTRHDDQT